MGVSPMEYASDAVHSNSRGRSSHTMQRRAFFVARFKFIYKLHLYIVLAIK
jgi:hypothetical protein